MPAIRLHIAAESRDLVHDVVVIEHADRSKIHPDRNGSLEQLSYLRGLGGGGEIPVEMGMTEKRVTHGAADAPGFESSVLETLGDTADGLRWIETLLVHISNMLRISASFIPAPRASMRSMRAC